jgi:HlyD family secretion protein
MKRFFVILILLPALFACKDSKGEYDASGRFEATELIISSEANGKVMELWAEEGARIESGSVLGYIDTIQLSLQKRRLLVGNQAVRARRADVSKQIAVLKQQVTNLEVERERAQKLVKADAGNRKTLEDIEAQIHTLQRQIEAQRSALESGNLSADKEGAAIEIQVAQTEDLIRKSIIVAPISGTISVKYVNRGEFRGVGQPLLKMADLDNLILRAYVSAKDLSGIKVGDEAAVFTGFDDETKKEYAGVVSWISQEAEFTPKNIQSREQRSNLVYAVKISVKNDGYIKMGMYGDVKFKKSNL